MQGGARHIEARVPEFAAAMKAVMMPGSNQAKVFSPIETIGECQWLAMQPQALRSRVLVKPACYGRLGEAHAIECWVFPRLHGHGPALINPPTCPACIPSSVQTS